MGLFRKTYFFLDVGKNQKKKNEHEISIISFDTRKIHSHGHNFTPGKIFVYILPNIFAEIFGETTIPTTTQFVYI